MNTIAGIYSNSLTNLSLNSEAQVRINQARALFVRMTDDTGAYVSPGGGTTDESAWTAGASSFSPTGGAFNDSAAALTSGQQGTARATANRALHVNLRDHLGNEATLTGNSLNVNVTNGGSGGTSSADLAAFTAGTTLGTPMLGVFNDGLTNLTSGQMGVPRMTNTRSMHVTLDNASVAVTGTFWQATQPVSGTFWQATQPISAASLPLPTGAALDSSVTTMSAKLPATLGQKLMASSMAVVIASDQSAVPVSGTFFQATQPVSIAAAVTVQQATASSLNVTVGNATIAVTQSGTWTDTVTQATASSLNAQVVGNIASASADSGNPVKVGGVYLSAPGTIATTGNRVNQLVDGQGKIVNAFAPISWVVTQQTTIASSSAETTIITAGAAGVFNDLQELILTNASATAVSCTIKDATAGTTRMIIDLAANGGAIIPIKSPGWPQAAAAANWTCTLSVATVTVHISAVAHQRK